MESARPSDEVSRTPEVVLPIELIDEVLDRVMEMALDDLNSQTMEKAREACQYGQNHKSIMRKAKKECKARKLDDRQALLPEIQQALTPLSTVTRHFRERTLRRLYQVHTMTVRRDTDLQGRLADAGRGLTFVRRLTLAFSQWGSSGPPFSVHILSMIFTSTPHLQSLLMQDCIFAEHASNAVRGYRLIMLDDLVVSGPCPGYRQYPSCVWSFLKLIASVENFHVAQLRDDHSEDQLLAIPNTLRTHLSKMRVKQFTLAPSRSVADVNKVWGSHLTPFPPACTMPAPAKVSILRVHGVSLENWSFVHAVCDAARDELNELEISLAASLLNFHPFKYVARFPHGPFPALRTLCLALPEASSCQTASLETLRHVEQIWQAVLVGVSQHLPSGLNTVRLKFSTGNLAACDAIKVVNNVSWQEWAKSLSQVGQLKEVMVYWRLSYGLDIVEAMDSIEKALVQGFEDIGFSPLPSMKVMDIRINERPLAPQQT